MLFCCYGDKKMMDNLVMVTKETGDEKLVYYIFVIKNEIELCLLYTSPSPRDKRQSRMPSSA